MKFIHIVLVLFASLLLVIVSFFIGNVATTFQLTTSIPSPTPRVTPDPQRISTPLFSIRLPKSWKIIELLDTEVLAISSDYLSAVPDKHKASDLKKGTMLAIKTGQGPLKPEDIAPDAAVDVRWRTTVNGEDAIVSVEKLFHKTYQTIHVQFDRDTTTYHLELNVHNDNEEEVEATLYSLLSSFRFR